MARITLKLPHASRCENLMREFQGVPHCTLWPEGRGFSPRRHRGTEGGEFGLYN